LDDWDVLDDLGDLDDLGTLDLTLFRKVWL
jgi:hypothetical protein